MANSETNRSVDSIRLANRLDELERLHDFFQRLAGSAGWPERLAFELTLACEELLTNTISYGYPDGGEHWIELTVVSQPRRIELTLEDDAAPFDPLAQADPDLTLDVEERAIGGLGIYFVKRLMDEIHYERTEAGNRLHMRKSYADMGA